MREYILHVNYGIILSKILCMYKQQFTVIISVVSENTLIIFFATICWHIMTSNYVLYVNCRCLNGSYTEKWYYDALTASWDVSVARPCMEQLTFCQKCPLMLCTIKFHLSSLSCMITLIVVRGMEQLFLWLMTTCIIPAWDIRSTSWQGNVSMQKIKKYRLSWNEIVYQS